LALFLDQAGKASQATLGGAILATPSNPLQFTYETEPANFRGLNASLRQSEGRPVDWHLVCVLNAGNLDCTAHLDSSSPTDGTVSLTRLGSASPADTLAPTVSSSVPANGATGVTATQVTVVFSELMSGTGAGAITLSGGAGVVGVPSYAGTANDVAGRTLTIPLSGLQSNTTYTLTLNPGTQTGFIDLAGNPLATTAISFTTQAVVVNSPPTANPANYTAVIGTPLPITLTGLDPEGGALTYTVVTPPASGNLTPTGTTATGNRTYTPGAAGAYSLTFIVTDPLGAQSTLATVNLTVQAPPVAFAQPVTMVQDTAKVITLQAEAEPGVTIATWNIVSGPTNGQLAAGSGSSRSYTPNPSFIGSDNFAFTVTDSRGLTSAPATVTITVTATPPTGLTADSQTITIRRRQIRTSVPASQWAITLTGSPSAVRFKVVRPPAHQDLAAPIHYYVGQTYQTGLGLPSVVALWDSVVESSGDVTVTPADKPSVFVFTPVICHYGDFSEDSFDFVAIDANGVQSAPATVTIIVSLSTSCQHL